ncbi:glycoside hydrolase family 3 N-terminal domain-containing protein [Kitasatospora paracochleata]|uniref:Beta-N-acetylhexosaminidase n=1 Tax=Kitasatospora paracochleata TaxID=58354 RepID=A0ABT1IT35_9ACTN|nr:glycoside hydrolase family 3 N-terminal domain-containing protein [Kitasatospora paracochleata]MCP2308071.1 beta-N-acetylhexosaminidase [Kitasatospora paracochleata]
MGFRWLVAGAVLLLAACSSGSGGGAPSSSGAPSAPSTSASASPPTSAAGTPTPTPTSASPTPASPSPTRSTPPATSPEQLAGRRVVYSYPGPTPPEALLQAVREGRVAGVIFFSENVPDPQTLRTAVDRLRRAQAQSPGGGPLLLMTDQEGGRVRRLPGAPEESARQVGLSADPVAAAQRTGAAAGANLASYGLNLNLAPVLDVFSTPGDFSDSLGRSYSDDPATVGRLGSAFIRSQQATGVAATAKHFPGLGTAPAGANTDTGPVVLPASAARLRGVDEVPYGPAIAAGVKLVMLSWAVYPALDGSRPAGLSPTVVQGELRGRLAFRGVTVSDALEAQALSAYGGTGARAVGAAKAGVDLLLCSARDVAQGDAAAAALAAGLRDGSLDRAQFDAAVARVDALRGGLH